MLAIIETGSKQYLVKPGERIMIEKLSKTLKEKEVIIFDKVLLIGDEKEVKVGSPIVAGAEVKAEFIGEKRAKKVTTIKHKAKKRYSKKQGHKQQMIEVEIKEIKV